jgi:hypothetical protein
LTLGRWVIERRIQAQARDETGPTQSAHVG